MSNRTKSVIVLNDQPAMLSQLQTDLQVWMQPSSGVNQNYHELLLLLSYIHYSAKIAIMQYKEHTIYDDINFIARELLENVSVSAISINLCLAFHDRYLISKAQILLFLKCKKEDIKGIVCIFVLYFANNQLIDKSIRDNKCFPLRSLLSIFSASP